jgi:hypothetical protein
MSSFPNEETQFQPGVSGNPAGRPKKTYTQHIADIKDKGYALPTTEEYKDMMLMLLSMTEEDLKQFATEKERPYWVRLIIIDLNNKQSRQKLMSDHRDWLFGKAQQNTDITSGGKSLVTEVKVKIIDGNGDKSTETV